MAEEDRLDLDAVHRDDAALRVRVTVVGIHGLDVELPPVAQLAQGDAPVFQWVEAHEGLLG
ncbi:hypothetical protein [Streptomyces canus]|uniref:hypothetical protein n=1 Tax=Streptomyces canus TaxID=58343 RepID=UPI0027860DB5|nr:hypothetical protein [Streptomyces canus]MDQ0765978.1 hypothetical protein [Streptomyces canus]